MQDLIQTFNNKEIKFRDINNVRFISSRDTLLALGYTNKEAIDAWRRYKPQIAEQSVIKSVDVFYPSKNRYYVNDYIDQEGVLYLLFLVKRPEAKPFKTWALKVLKNQVNAQLNGLAGSEQEISNSLSLLASRSRNNLVFEQSEESEELYGTDRFGLPRCKRYDIIQNLGKLYRIYEIKKGKLTSLEAFNTVQKDYLELAAIVSGGKKLELIMIADGIEQGAQDYITRLGAETEYQPFTIKDISYEAKIRYVSLNDFAMELYNKALKKCPQGGVWALNDFVVRYCHPVFNDIQIQAFKKGLFSAPKPVYYMEASA